jgi:hypothetical protein
MKKTFVILAATLASITAFAQGKLSFSTDSLHLVYYNPGYPGFGGQGVYAGNMPAGINFVADLYVGTSASSLSLISSTTFSSAPGKFNTISVQVPGIPSGSVYTMAQIRDSAYPAESVWTPGFVPPTINWGSSDVFTFTLGISITYPPFWGSNGTWARGTFPMDQYGTGSLGAIMVGIPEPSCLALAGLGTAALLLRRRK